MKNLRFLLTQLAFILVLNILQINASNAAASNSSAPIDTTRKTLCVKNFPTTESGVLITQPGVYYTNPFVRPNDTLSILEMTVYACFKDTINLSACAEDFPISYGDLLFNRPTRQEMSSERDSNGCPIYLFFAVEQYPSYHNHIVQNVCLPDLPFIFNGDTLTTTGIYTYNDTTVLGCDSITVLDLRVHQVYDIHDTLIVNVCSFNLPYTVGDSSFTQTGIYDFPIHSAGGCDSVFYHLDLTVTQTQYDTLTASICHNDFPYAVDSLHTYSAAGTYYIEHADTTLCPSVTVVMLEDKPVYSDTVRASICASDAPYIFLDTNFSTSIVYTHHDTTQLGCDSNTTLVLTVWDVYQDTLYDTLHLCAYDMPYTYGDTVFAQAGTFVFENQTQYGCDSTTFIMEVLVAPIPRDTVTLTLCQNDVPYLYGDTLIPAFGTYDLIFPDTVTFGCDTFRHLVVDSLPIYFDTLEVTVCENTTYMVGDSALTEPGVYDILLKTVDGCDSLITITFNHFPTYRADTLTFETCVYDLPFVYADTSFSTAGFHEVWLESVNGCDSIIPLNLTIWPVIYNSDTLREEICASQLPYTTAFGRTYTAAGLYSDTTTSLITGCDSIFYYRLTVHANPTPTISGQNHLCQGTSTQLTATGDMIAYAWNNGASSQVIDITAANTYRVTVTDHHNCQGTASHTVTAAALPSLVLSSTQTICKGSTATLTASGADHYVWDNASTSASITVQPATTTTYHVTAYSNLACQRTGNVQVVVNDLPTPVITGPDEICQGASATMIASGGVSYRWSTNATGDRITAYTDGVYTVTATDANNCSNSVSKTLIMHALPTVAINGRTPFCQGESTTLTATGAVTYSWSTGETTPSITTSYANTYSVTGTDIHGCSSSANKQITMWQVSAQIVGTRNFCQGGHTTLSVTGNETYTYHWNDGSTASSLDIYTPGTYSVSVTNALGCTNTISANVSENPAPTATITGTTTICQGRTAILRATGGNSYLWSDGTTNAYLSATQTGTYFVTVTNAQGCTATTSETVIVNPLPEVTINGLTDICSGQQVSLFAMSPTAIQFNWPMSGQQGQLITVNPSTTTLYTVMVTDDNGCTNTASTTINVQSVPTPYLNGPTVICQGETATYTISGGTSYLWNNGSTATTLNATQAGQYSVTAFNTYGCSASASTTLTVNALPDVDITPDTAICQGSSVLLEVEAPVGCTYQWSNGSRRSYITATAAGIYTVTVTNSNGCSTIRSTEVTIHALPQVTISGITRFCDGESTTLTATGDAGNSYLWNNGVTNAPITISSAGTYSVTATNAFGCTQNASITVTKLTNPTATISGGSTICPGSSALLTANNAAHYAWSTGDTTRSVSVTPTTTTSYTVTITDGNGCHNSTQATVSIGSVPTVAISGNLSFCEGGSTQLTATSGYSYHWSTNATTATITATAAGTYKVTATNTLGCTAVASATVTTHALPVLNFGIQHAICAGESYTYQLPNNLNYRWSTGATGNQLTVSNAGIYQVTATNSYGCTATAADSLVVNALPTPSIAGATTICANANILLTASNAAHYHWSTGDTTRVISVSPATTTAYIVTVTDINGCQGSTTATVNIGSAPSVAISGNLSFCEGQSTLLTATSGYNYRWSDNATTASITVNTPGTYKVTVTDAIGCTAVDSAVVTANPLPSLNFGIQHAICAGESYTYQLPNNLSYHWSTGATGNQLTVSTAGIYRVTATNTYGCTATAADSLIVHPLPTPTISDNTVICPGTSATLVAGSATHYVWSNGDTSQVITVSPASTTVYSVTITDQNGCHNSTHSTVSIGSTPTVSISGTPSFCAGQSTQLTATPGYNYVWSNNATTSSINVSTPGKYKVTATNVFGCTATDSVTVVSHPLPTLIFGMQHTICEGTTYTYSMPGSLTYHWSTGATGNQLTVSTAGIYRVTATNEYGCSTTAADSLIVIALPVPTISGNTTVCRGNSTTLTADGGMVYQWSTGYTGRECTVTPNTNTLYTVTAYNQYGCSASTNTTVTVKALPTVSFIGSNTFCDGSSTTITAQGASMFLWSTGANTSNITINVPGTYYVQATNASNCTKVDSITITRLDNPVVTISGENLVCESTPHILTASGADTYVWSTGENTESITITPAATNTYTVTGSNANGCSTEVSKVVNVEALPDVHISGINTICQGDSTVFTASNGNTYLWNTGSTSNHITVSVAGNYSVTATSANGCTASTTATLAVNPTPSASISGSPTLCEHTSQELVANGGQTYLWSNGSTQNAITINTGGTYSVTTTNTYGCSTSATLDVTTLPAPYLFLNGSVPVCEGNSVTVQTFGNGVHFQWSNGDSTQNLTVTPTHTTLYYVTARSHDNCASFDSVLVIVNPTYEQTFTDEVCQGNPYSLHGFNLPVQNEVGTFTHNLNLQSVNGCDSILILNLTVKPRPVLPSTISGENHITNYGTYLYNVDSTLYANSYEWRVSNTNWTLTNSNTSSAFLTINVNGSGLLTVKANNECASVERSISILCNVGVEEYVNDTHILLYPVPTHDLLNIDLSEAVLHVEQILLVDALGRTLNTLPATESKLQLDCTALSTGHYFVRFLDKNGKIIDTRKIIVNR